MHGISFISRSTILDSVFCLPLGLVENQKQWGESLTTNFNRVTLLDPRPTTSTTTCGLKRVVKKRTVDDGLREQVWFYRVYIRKSRVFCRANSKKKEPFMMTMMLLLCTHAPWPVFCQSWKSHLHYCTTTIFIYLHFVLVVFFFLYISSYVSSYITSVCKMHVDFCVLFVFFVVFL